METLKFPISAGQLGLRLGAEVVGDPDLELSCLAPISVADEGALTYFSDKRFLAQLERIQKVAVFTTSDLVRPDLPLTYLIVDKPQEVFSGVAQQFLERPLETGIDPTAWIHPEAQIAKGAGIGAHSRIGRGTKIAKGASIGAFCVVGDSVEVGEDTILYPRVTILDRVSLGKRVLIFPGAVLGSDGFGFVPAKDGALPRLVPQVGSVVIEDDVRIGANCTIDRGTIGETRVGRGTKIDNQVHIGHNVRLGVGCLVCAQVGIAGSVVIGDGVLIGGQAGISDGVRIGNGAKVGGSSSVFSHVIDGDTVLMSPSLPKKKALPILKYMRKLPEMWERLKALEARNGGGV